MACCLRPSLRRFLRSSMCLKCTDDTPLLSTCSGINLLAFCQPSSFSTRVFRSLLARGAVLLSSLALLLPCLVDQPCLACPQAMPAAGGAWQHMVRLDGLPANSVVVGVLVGVPVQPQLFLATTPPQYPESVKPPAQSPSKAAEVNAPSSVPPDEEHCSVRRWSQKKKGGPKKENSVPILNQPGVRWYGTIAQMPMKIISLKGRDSQRDRVFEDKQSAADWRSLLFQSIFRYY